MRDVYIQEILRDLKNYNNLQDSIKNMEDILYCIDQDLKSIQAINYDGMPKGQGKKTHTRVEKLIMEKDAIQSKIDRTNRKVFIINNCLNLLEAPEQKIIRDVIINNVNINTVINELNISKSEFYRIKDECLYKISVKMFGVDAL